MKKMTIIILLTMGLIGCENIPDPIPEVTSVSITSTTSGNKTIEMADTSASIEIRGTDFDEVKKVRIYKDGGGCFLNENYYEKISSNLIRATIDGWDWPVGECVGKFYITLQNWDEEWSGKVESGTITVYE